MSFKGGGVILELCYGPQVMSNVKEQFLLIKFYAMGYLVDCIFLVCYGWCSFISFFVADGDIRTFTWVYSNSFVLNLIYKNNFASL